MWHEARKQEKLIRSKLVDSAKRHERRQAFYAQIVRTWTCFPSFSKHVTPRRHFRGKIRSSSCKYTVAKLRSTSIQQSPTRRKRRTFCRLSDFYLTFTPFVCYWFQEKMARRSDCPNRSLWRTSSFGLHSWTFGQTRKGENVRFLWAKGCRKLTLDWKKMWRSCNATTSGTGYWCLTNTRKVREVHSSK